MGLLGRHLVVPCVGSFPSHPDGIVERGSALWHLPAPRLDDRVFDPLRKPLLQPVPRTFDRVPLWQLKEFSEFDLNIKLPNKKNQIIKKFKIPLLGNHNIKNSVAAAALALTVGLPINNIKKGLKNFKGVQRRFNKIFNFNNVDFYDDYAHHPTEIKEVLNGIKNVYKDYEKICIFQPHRVSRLKDLKKEFTFAFKNADKVILFPIYTAGEKLKLGFSYINFAKEIIKNSKVQLFLVDDKFQLAKFIKANIYGKKIVIGMGAGTISTWMRELPKLL